MLVHLAKRGSATNRTPSDSAPSGPEFNRRISGEEGAEIGVKQLAEIRRLYLVEKRPSVRSLGWRGAPGHDHAGA